jgi:hypothetical protein
LLGPDWHRIRVVTIGKQVVVLIGSDVDLLKTAVKNVKGGEAGLDADRRLASFRKQGNADRKIELHVGLAALAMLTDPRADLSKLKAGAPLSSASLTVETDRLELNAFAPMDDVKLLVKQAGW